MEINATLIVQSFLFLFLLMWLSRFLFQPFLKLFDAREKAIEGSRLEAGELQQVVLRKQELVEAKMKEAQKEARRLLLELKAEGVQYQRSIVEAAKEEAKRKTHAAENKFAQEVQQIRQQLAQDIPVLSKVVMSRILGDEPTGMSSSSFDKMESRGA